MKRDEEEYIPVHMAADETAYNRVINRIKDEAADRRDRWAHLHEFKAATARLQSVYALTCHNSQGSTYEGAFIDVRDIRRRETSNLLETQQMLYVAAPGPSRR